MQVKSVRSARFSMVDLAGTIVFTWSIHSLYMVDTAHLLLQQYVWMSKPTHLSHRDKKYKINSIIINVVVDDDVKICYHYNRGYSTTADF